jgi:hypothetical protein
MTVHGVFTFTALAWRESRDARTGLNDSPDPGTSPRGSSIVNLDAE